MTSKPNFTPGPWNVAPMDLRMFRITRDLSCWVDICRNVLTEENANLIATAPEMYELLQELCDTRRNGVCEDGECDECPINRVLMKARGEE